MLAQSVAQYIDFCNRYAVAIEATAIIVVVVAVVTAAAAAYYYFWHLRRHFSWAMTAERKANLKKARQRPIMMTNQRHTKYPHSCNDVFVCAKWLNAHCTNMLICTHIWCYFHVVFFFSSNYMRFIFPFNNQSHILNYYINVFAMSKCPQFGKAKYSLLCILYMRYEIWTLCTCVHWSSIPLPFFA